MKSMSLLGSFASVQDVAQAARELKRRGFHHLEILSSQEIEGLDEILGSSARSYSFSVVGLCGAVSGLLTGYIMQWYANVESTRLDIAGKPLNSWPAFVPVCFILTILFSAFSLLFFLIFKLKLPEPYHPVFRTSLDLSQSYFYIFLSFQDPQSDSEKVRALLTELHAIRVEEVPCD